MLLPASQRKKSCVKQVFTGKIPLSNLAIGTGIHNYQNNLTLIELLTNWSTTN